MTIIELTKKGDKGRAFLRTGFPKNALDMLGIKRHQTKELYRFGESTTEKDGTVFDKAKD